MENHTGNQTIGGENTMKESYASMMSIEEMMEEEDALQYLHYSETLKQEKKVAYEME